MGRHICSRLMEDLAELRGKSNDSRFQDSHKEETARVHKDEHDREALKRKLEICIHPLNPEMHPKQIVNVANGTLEYHRSM